MIIIDFNEQQPIYSQIVDYVSEHILLGLWIVGGRLPSVRELAVALDVNHNTVMRAYKSLQYKGIVCSHRGLGLFISDDGLQKARLYRTHSFRQQEVPRFFASMTILEIGIGDLDSLFSEFKRRRSSATC